MCQRPIRGVAYDLEGTMVDLECYRHASHLRVARDAGVNFTFDEALKALPHLIGGPDEQLFSEIYALGDKRLTVPEMIALDRRYFHEALQSATIAMRPGLEDNLAVIYEKFLPVQMAIGSSTPKDEAKLFIERSGLDRFFEDPLTVLGGDVINRKPAPDTFLETARRMGTHPSEQLVFEDSLNGVKAAVAAGSPVVAVVVYNRPEIVCPLIEAGALRVFADWREMDIAALIRNLSE